MNNKYIEALEKILKLTSFCVSYYQEGKIGEHCIKECPNYPNKCIYAIATQALAPQECDVSKCPNFTGEMRFNCSKHLKITGANGDCRDIKNCDYKHKQLHSQEKTFTVEVDNE